MTAKPHQIVVRRTEEVGAGVTADVIDEDGKVLDTQTGLTNETLSYLSSDLDVPVVHEDAPA